MLRTPDGTFGLSKVFTSTDLLLFLLLFVFPLPLPLLLEEKELAELL